MMYKCVITESYISYITNQIKISQIFALFSKIEKILIV
jgi:hypothetical protein